MIRPATPADIPAMLELLADLHSRRPRPLGYDRSHLAGRLAHAIVSPDWLALMSTDGMIVASAGPTMASPDEVAIEHFWIARDGEGMLLKAVYEAWALARGCVAIHIGGVPGDRLGPVLERDGYAAAEVAWVKVVL